MKKSFTKCNHIQLFSYPRNENIAFTYVNPRNLRYYSILNVKKVTLMQNKKNVVIYGLYCLWMFWLLLHIWIEVRIRGKVNEENYHSHYESYGVVGYINIVKKYNCNYKNSIKMHTLLVRNAYQKKIIIIIQLSMLNVYATIWWNVQVCNPKCVTKFHFTSMKRCFHPKKTSILSKFFIYIKQTLIYSHILV